MSDFKIQDGQTVLLTGDSITDCGRRDKHYPLGAGYARMVVQLVAARYPERTIAFHNRGVAGDVVTQLRDRWTDDCIALQPDWVSILVGINDAGRRFRPERDQVPPELYREAYTHILQRTRDETDARLILLQPFLMTRDTDPASSRTRLRESLEEYKPIVAELAEQFDAVFVPLDDVFARHLEHRPPEYFCSEPVHPGQPGHMVIAHEWLRAVGW
jgi:lysophospholipase L1-like esterase